MVGKGRKCRRCEVCGVRESLRGGFFASFPKDELRCKTWVTQTGNEDLVHVPIEKLHEERHICGDHFERRDFGKTGKRLKKRAYPKLHLLAPPLSDHQITEFPQHVVSKQESIVDSWDDKEKTLQKSSCDHTYARDAVLSQINDFSDGKPTGIEILRQIQPSTLSTGNRTNNGISDRKPTGPDNLRQIQPSTLSTDNRTNNGISDEQSQDAKGTKQEEAIAEDTTAEEMDNDDDLAVPAEAEELFSWQKSELITADDDGLEKPTADPEPGEPADPSGVSLYDDEPQFVSSTPGRKNIEYLCKECGEFIEGFQFWCVQCLGSALCGACDARGAHRDHCVLRVPAHRPHRQTQAVLAAIRHQLENEHLFAQRETCDGRVKLEVKEEPGEQELPAPDSRAECDPLAGSDLEPDPDFEPDPQPQPELELEPAPEPQRVSHDHLSVVEEPDRRPFKKPRLLPPKQVQPCTSFKRNLTKENLKETLNKWLATPVPAGTPINSDHIATIELNETDDGLEYTDMEVLEDIDVDDDRHSDDYDDDISRIVEVSQEVDSEGIATRGVDRRHENDIEDTMRLRGPQGSMLQYVPEEAVVRVEPLRTVDIRKWTADSKRRKT